MKMKSITGLAPVVLPIACADETVIGAHSNQRDWVAIAKMLNYPQNSWDIKHIHERDSG
jgi:hypothetical protein